MTRRYYTNRVVTTTAGVLEVSACGTPYARQPDGSLRRCDSRWIPEEGVLAVFVGEREVRLKSTPGGLVQV